MTRARATLRYAAVSGGCMLTHNAVLIVADGLGHSILAGSLASFCVVVVVGYLLHSRYTFAAPRSWRDFVRYSAAMGANVPLSVALIWAFTVPTGWPMPVGAPAATLAAFAVNYAAGAWAMSPATGRAAARERA